MFLLFALQIYNHKVECRLTKSMYSGETLSAFCKGRDIVGWNMSKVHLCIILMGQNNSEPLEPRSVLLQNWLPHENEPNVFVNRVTQEQIQRHFDLPRQTALFSTRMNNHQPYICRLLYFHPAPSEQKSSPDSERQFREMYIYTDKTVSMKDWNRQKMLVATQGLKKLIAIYGPFRISESTIRENEHGEVKLWINENPVNNYPDFKYNNEQYVVGDLAALLARKNEQLANSLLGCRSLRDVTDRLNKPARQNHSPYQNYSHRASDSGEVNHKKLENQDKGFMTPYRNVFGEISDSHKQKNEGNTTPNKISSKNFENYPLSAMIIKEDDNKPQSNTSNLDRYREFLYPSGSKLGLHKQDKMMNKSKPKGKMNQDSSLQFKKNKPEEQNELKYKLYKPQNVESAKQEYPKSNEYLTFTSSMKNATEPVKPFAVPHRFETMANLSSYNTQSYISPKGVRTGHYWHSGQPNLFATTHCESHQEMPRISNPGPGFKQERRGAYDITIINNNVNNFISNITHNHIVNVEKKQNEQFHQFRPPASRGGEGSQYSSKIQSNQASQIGRNNPKTGKERNYNIPIFIQQKKKASSNWPEQPITLSTKSKSNNTLERKDTVTSNPQETQQSVSPFSNEKTLQSNDFINKSQHSESKKPKQIYTNNTEPSVSPFKFGSNYSAYPKTSASNNPNNFASFQKINGSFQTRMPLRTKTTEFFQKERDAFGKSQISVQNKSFTQHQIEKSGFQTKTEYKQTKFAFKEPFVAEDAAQQFLPYMPNKLEKSQSKPEPSTPKEEPRLDFKKQLRNEFKFLLGAEVTTKREQAKPQPVISYQKEAEMKEAKEVGLKDKIKMKQIVFAQLKKEALKVLTDD